MQSNGVNLPRYQCHKIVQACRIKALDYDGIGGARIIPTEPGVESFVVSGEFMRRHKPQVGGYYVYYEDGYQSWSPASAFESGYDRIED